MSQIDFFTPIVFQNAEKSFLEGALEWAEWVLPSNDEKAFALAPTEATSSKREVVVLTSDPRSWEETVQKIALYATVIIPLICLAIKAYVRSMYTFELFDAQKDLEQGVEVTKEVQTAVSRAIQNNYGVEGVKIIIRNSNVIFTLEAFPNLIFKTGQNNMSVWTASGGVDCRLRAKDRFAYMVTAHRVCKALGLDQLYVPHAKLFEVSARGTTFQVLAEERLDIPAEETVIEGQYASKLTDRHVTQLVDLIARTHFSDVEFRNMPMIDGGRIALIDLEECASSVTGIYGGGRSGLLKLLPTVGKVDLALQRAGLYAIEEKSWGGVPARARNVERLEREAALRAFHQERGYNVEPAKPIILDNLESLGLDLEQTTEVGGQTIRGPGGKKTTLPSHTWKMRDALNFLIGKLNEYLIARAEKCPDAKGVRNIYLNVNRGDFDRWNSLGRSDDSFAPSDEKESWAVQILDALVKEKLIYSYYENGHGFFIQA